jgi:diguanylate cyclase (GGDEF)-like protein/PAS domain S-box-containing protein
VLLITAIAAGTGYAIDHFRRRALQNAERELENTALLLARHLDEELRQLDLVEANLIDHIRSLGITNREEVERRMGGDDVHQMLKNQMKVVSYGSRLSLADAKGKLINSSYAWPVKPVNFADRDYFKTLKANPQLQTLLSEPIQSRLTGDWTIVFARKVTSPAGDFLGLALGGIDLAHFEKFFASVTLGEGASIALFTRDGRLLARHPPAPSMMGFNFSTGPREQHRLFTNEHLTVRLSSRIDGQERLVSAHRLTHFPLIVMPTAMVSTVLADWRQQTRTLISVAGLSVILIGAVLLLIVRQLWREHTRSGKRLELEKQRLDTAVNNMAQGLLLFDASGRIVLVNGRYIDMYGLSADVVRPGCTLRNLIRHCQETGCLVGDVADYCSAILRNVAQGKENQMIIRTADGRSIRIVDRPLADGGWVCTHEDITERQRLHTRMAYLALHDALTDLPNRVLLRQQLEQTLVASQGDAKAVVVLCLDLDRFKEVNDTLGHAIGDELLRAVSTRLRATAREHEFVARLGGDEFAVVIATAEPARDGAALAGQIIESLAAPHVVDGHQLVIGTSIGIAVTPRDGSSAEHLLQSADLALYCAKADGRGTFRFFEPEMNLRMQARRSLETDLRKALEGGQLALHYQPLVNLERDEICGCEALLRWIHPQQGPISPADFIPVAEATGLIVPIGEWVLREACREAATWPSDLKVAVNLSVSQFKSPNLVQIVVGALASSGLLACRLELEITESVLLGESKMTVELLRQLRTLGVRIALDDFGTGYSSMSYLHNFPFDKIKIDRCFVSKIGSEGQNTLPILRTITQLGRSLGVVTTAEGVETQEQLNAVRAEGCNELQGYFFSPPIAAEALRDLLARRHPLRANAA